MYNFNIESVAASWHMIIQSGLNTMEANYLKQLDTQEDWLPGKHKIFNAFSQPINNINYILFGESPYPRANSANGYAFWDAAVHELWSVKGLSREVNRATSLRNFIKMLLLARGDLSAEDTSQNAIQQIDKTHLVKSIDELFNNLLNAGFLLLNASLVLSNNAVAKEARYWKPFMEFILQELYQHNPNIQLILLGNIAKQINQLPSANKFQQFRAEHPYNISFITNPEILKFFKPFNLLNKEKIND